MSRDLDIGYWKDIRHAIRFGRMDVVEEFLKQGADVNGLYPDEWPKMTPLEQATNTRYAEELIPFLLKRGADVNVNPCGYNGSALSIAVEHGDINSMKLLLDAGALPKVSLFELKGKSREVYDLLVRYGFEVSKEELIDFIFTE